MPVENEFKRDSPTSPTTKAGVKLEVQNEPPPFSALAHINIENREFVVKLCPGRHNPDKPRKPKAKVGPDGKAIKPPKPCKNDTCNMRTGMIDGLLEKTVKMKERMVEIAGMLEVVNEERQEAEAELATQQQYLNESEQRHELLVREEQECDDELAKANAAMVESKNSITNLEMERQRLARIVFENKLKQQGVELEAFPGDGLTYQPSRSFGGEPGDYEGEPRDDSLGNRTGRGGSKQGIQRIPDWCTMEPLNLPERLKVSRGGRRGVQRDVAVHRPKTCPPSASRGSPTWRAWESQAFVLPQPSWASSTDDASVRRVAAAQGQHVAKVNPQTLDPRPTFALQSRATPMLGALAQQPPPPRLSSNSSSGGYGSQRISFGRSGAEKKFAMTQRPGTTPARSPIGKAGTTRGATLMTPGSDSISMVTDGSARTTRGLPKLEAAMR